MQKVPELSLRAYSSGNVSERGRFIDLLFSGLKEYGFIILKDHPIDVGLLHKAYRLSERLFSLSVTSKET